MNVERPLVEWARKVQTTCSGNPIQLREKLEATLEPMISCALRTGLGQPRLLSWVEEQLPRFGGKDHSDPTRLAAPLARALSERLMARLQSFSGRDTVIGT